MTDYKKLVEALRYCTDRNRMDCHECKYEQDFPCRIKLIADAADAIEELDAEETRLLLLTSDLQDKLMDLQAKVNRLELDNEDYEHEHRRLKGEIEALQAENPIVETVLVDKLRQRIDELEEKQTYCDAYGDKWMTSGKDVPTAAYEHGYADGKAEERAKMQKRNAELHAELEKWVSVAEKAGVPKRGEWVYEDLDNFRKYKVTCPHCGAWYVGNYDAYDDPSEFLYCPHCGNICNPTNLDWENELKEREKEARAKMEVQDGQE